MATQFSVKNHKPWKAPFFSPSGAQEHSHANMKLNHDTFNPVHSAGITRPGNSDQPDLALRLAATRIALPVMAGLDGRNG